MAKPRIAFFPVGTPRTASARFRIQAFVPYFSEAGYEAKVFWPVLGGGNPFARVLDLIRDVARAGRFDAVVVQRKTYPPPFNRWLRRHARHLIFDFDDAIFMPPPRLGAEGAPLALRRRYLWNFRATLQKCDAAVCGNVFLEAMAKPFVQCTHVIPTGLDAAQWAPFSNVAPPPRNGGVLGWVGSADNLRYLEAILPALEALAARRPELTLRVVCNAPLHLPESSRLKVENIAWTLARETEDFRGIHVGLMPLAHGPWERGKCAFKAVQYMALGIPTVASPVGENARLVQDGANGLLASTPEEWTRKIETLLDDSVLRARVAREGRETVARERSLSALAPQWIKVVDSLLNPEDAWKNQE